MSSVVAQVLTRLFAIVSATVPAGCQAFLDRADALSRAEAPSVNIQSRGAQVQSFSGEFDKHTLLIEVQITVRDDAPTQAAEDIHSALHPAIVSDVLLSQLVDSVRLEEDTTQLTSADATVFDKTVRYRFTYLINQFYC